MAVDTNNRTTVTVGGKEYEIEASNGACALYAKEFREKEKKPYTGNLITDISIETAECAQMDNSYPMWCDVPHLEQAIWAMAKALVRPRIHTRRSTRSSWTRQQCIWRPPTSLAKSLGSLDRVPFFGTSRDRATLEYPTTKAKKKGSSTQPNYTVEADTWKAEATILALMGCGFSFEDAWHLSPLDTKRFVAINNAWSIPPEDRIAGAVLGTVDQLKELMG